MKHEYAPRRLSGIYRWPGEAFDIRLGAVVREGTGWPELPENQVINEFVISLPGHQRGVLAILLEGAFKEGAHQVLAYMSEMIDLKQLRLTQRGRELPVAPFGTELHYDWVCRLADDDWPESTE